MSKSVKLQEIPFDVELLGTPGITVGCRQDGVLVLEVQTFKTANTLAYPVYALCVNSSGGVYHEEFTRRGCRYEYDDKPYLVMYREAPCVSEYYLNVYKHGLAEPRASLADARASATTGAVGVLCVQMYNDGAVEVQFIPNEGEA